MSKPPEFAPATLEQWAKAAAKSAPEGRLEALNWVTPEGITVKPLYTAADLAGLLVVLAGRMLWKLFH